MGTDRVLSEKEPPNKIQRTREWPGKSVCPRAWEPVTDHVVEWWSNGRREADGVKAVRGQGAQDLVDYLKCRDVLALELHERHPVPWRDIEPTLVGCQELCGHSPSVSLRSEFSFVLLDQGPFESTSDSCWLIPRVSLLPGCSHCLESAIGIHTRREGSRARLAHLIFMEKSSCLSSF